MTPTALTFFGSGQFAVASLQALAQDRRWSIASVVTLPDKPVGRKQQLRPTPVKVAAQALGLPVSEHLPNQASTALAVVVYYGVLIPAHLLDQYDLGMINIHPSLLPRWRGPAPMRAALLAGDTKTGVTIMKLDQGMDTGPIISQITVPLTTDTTALELENHLAQLGADLLSKTLPEYVAGQAVPQPQSTDGVTYSHLVKRSDGKIEPTDSAEMIWRKIRALLPWPGVYFEQANQRFKIIDASRQADRIIINQIQPAGKRVLTWAEFKRGYPTIQLPNLAL